MSQQEELPWMFVAKSLIGTKENPGKRSNNPNILQWAALAEIPGYTDDDIPWCGLFVAHCLVEAGVEYVKDPLWARNWVHFGKKLDQPAYGAIMVFQRPSGGHVAFYTGEDDDHYFVLGGNQSDQVNITKIAKNRLLGIAWPTRFLARLGTTATQTAGDYDESKDEA